MLFFREVNAVKSISATSAREIHAPLSSSRIASVYSIVVYALSSMPAIAALIVPVSRTVTDTSAPALIAVPTVACP